MEILSAVMIIAEIIFILIFIFEVIKKNRFASLNSGSAKVKKIAVSFLMVIVIALGAAIGRFFIAQSNYNSAYDLAYDRAFSNSKGNDFGIYESYSNAFTEAVNSKEANEYKRNMNNALVLCIILSVMGGVDSIILFGTNQKLKKELSAVQYTERSTQQNTDRQAQARFCSNCGAEIQSDCLFCEHCGKRL